MLRLLVKAGATPKNLNAIISATSPLNADLKEQCRQAFGMEVTEIYGFSEAGSVAWRKSEETWHLLPGLNAKKSDSGDTVITDDGNIIATVEDRVELIDSQTLLLKGRPDDLVKIGGKRASLAGLIQKLQSLATVNDGHLFYNPDSEVLEAYVVPSDRTSSAREIRRQYAQICDLSFVPRRFSLVEKIPRTATGKVSKADLAALQKQAQPAVQKPQREGNG